jgi:MoaA/NifB/PqqE/SkfB family radical SAM enzyme
MRDRSLRHDAWEKAVDGILLTQSLAASDRSRAQVTIRTVVARPNLLDVPSIPEALRNRGVDLSAARIKMYQVEPFGPHVPNTNFEGEWAISSDDAIKAYQHVLQNCPEGNVTLQLYSKTGGRYFLVDPDGNATGTDFDGTGNPIEIPYGNLVKDFDAALDAYIDHQGKLSFAA